MDFIVENFYDALDAYRAAFDEVHSHAPREQGLIETESTVSGPIKMAEMLAPIYFENL